MNAFAKLLEKLRDGDTASEELAAKGIAEFGDLLEGWDYIRVYVDGTPNFGHQATSVQVLKRIIDRFQYKGRVVVVYQDGPPNKAPTTAEKLAVLLPGLVPADIDTTKITYGTCTDIRFVNYTKRGSLDRAPFGITGGADDIGVNLATELNTELFLRLQPYVWRNSGGGFVPNRIEMHGEDVAESIDLGKLSSVFPELPYKFDAAKVGAVPDAVWQWYEGQGFDHFLSFNTRDARTLLTAVAARGNVKVWPSYGLHQFKEGDDGPAGRDILLTMVLTALSYQASLGFNGPPIVLALLNERTQLDFTFVEHFANHEIGAIKSELESSFKWGPNDPLPRQYVAPINQIATDLTQMYADYGGAQHLFLEPLDISGAIANAPPGEVLVIPIGRVPQDVYNLLYATAEMPGVFEGQGTSSLVISLGKPYLQTPKRGVTGNNYPSAILVEDDYSRITRYCNLVAELFRTTLTSLAGGSLPSDAKGTTYRQIVDGGRDFIDHAYGEDDVNEYFEGLETFFQEDVHDKLLVGLLTFSSILGDSNTNLLRARARGAVGPLDLQGVYRALQGAWKDGAVDLLAALPGSNLAAFYGAITGQSWPVRVAQSDIVAVKDSGGSLVRVTVQNATTSAFGPAFGATLDFTADLGPVSSSLRCRAADDWGIAGVPWLVFTQPGFDMRVSEASLPVEGAMVGTLKDAGLTLQIRYPVAGDRWVVTGTFASPYPSVATFYAMAGGVNLVQSLPAPLSTLAGFGLQEAQFVYDAKSTAIEYLLFVMSTDSPWNILAEPKIAVTPTVKAVIKSPGDLANRSTSFQITGAFTIGAGTVLVSAQYPSFQLSATLADGVIDLKDLVALFHADVDLAAQVTAFDMFMQPDVGDYSITTALTTDWPIPSSAPIFTITGLGFDVHGSRSGYTVTFSGSTTILPEDPDVALSLQVVASYLGSGNGWSFSGQQTSGQVPLGKLLDRYLGWHTDQPYGIDGLGLTVATKDGSWSFSGKTAEPWAVPFAKDLTVQASLTAGRRGAGGAEPPGPFARIETEWRWQSIDLLVWFDYDPTITQFGITWGKLQGKVSGPDASGDWTASLSLARGETIGSMIETMISWITGSRFSLEAPWSVLDDISLDGVSLNYTFNKQDPSRDHVSLTVGIGPIDLGFARIDGFEVGYQSSGPKSGVNVSLRGSFPWNIGSEAQGDTSTLGPWDASKPGAAPAPPGNGNKYLDLRLLALGQHVTVDGITQAKTVQEAIGYLAKLPDTEQGQIPAVSFDPESAWLIGADFGVLRLDEEGSKSSTAAVRRADVALFEAGPRQALAPRAAEGLTAAGAGYFITLQLVFNDPHLYGLRIALDGGPAKVFKGLDFQIMYRQVSPAVGVYQAEITLPDLMRHLSVGACSLTLPVFGIAVYTNGDFLVDVGFPWNQDFSRSFSIEAIIPPGIPLLGSAGFYFGKLSSATTSRVPAATNGTFNPVIVFGLGMQVGFGKSINYGVLSAGFSVTLVGILEGVIAKWNPYALTTGGDPGQLQGAYYFWLQGTVGIIGHLYGSVDFAIVKASVDVIVKLLLQLTYESFVSLNITVMASVDVSVSVSIDLGLFSISIDFSFSMRLKETFTIDNHGDAPWQVAAPAPRSLLRAPVHRRVRAHRAALQRRGATRAAPAAITPPAWGNLLAPAAPDKAKLTGYLAPGLTVARDEWQDAADPAAQVPCYVAMLLIDSAPGAARERALSARRAAGDAPDTSFEILCKTVLRWVIAATQAAAMSAAEVDALLVDDAALGRLLDEVLVSTDEDPVPIPPDAIDRFLGDQLTFTASRPPAQGQADTTFFPVPPALGVSVPAYGASYPATRYTFGGYNTISTGALGTLRAELAALEVQVQAEDGERRAARARDDDGLSVATFVFADYFLLVARQMVQAARDGLRDFKLPIEAGQTPQSIADWVNQTGRLTGDERYSTLEVFVANQTHALAGGKQLVIGVRHPVAAGDTFSTVAAAFGPSVTAGALAAANAAVPGVLPVGAIVTYPNEASYTVQAGDRLLDVAAKLHVSFGELLASSSVLADGTTLAVTASLVVPVVTYQALASDTFASIAGSGLYGAIAAADLATQNAGGSILAAGATIQLGTAAHTVAPGECLGDVAAALGVSLADLLARSGVLSQAGILAPVGVLVIPPFAGGTSAGDTLHAVAARYGVTLDVLADAPENGGVADLFDGSSDPNLDLPHLARFPVGELIREAQRALAMQHLSGMAARYHLHGLRVPTDGIAPRALGMWVHASGTTLSLPKEAGLYALTGQQIQIPELGADTFTITFDASGGPSWLSFDTGATLQIEVVPGSTDAKRIAALVGYARGRRVAVPLGSLGADAPYRSDLATYPLRSMLVWQSAGPVTLPHGTPPAGPATLRLWRLPDSLVNLPDPATRAHDPHFMLATGRFDEASGATVESRIDYFGWATIIGFTVKRVPPVDGSPASRTTYAIAGASGGDVVILERLLAQVKGDDAFFAGIHLGFAPAQTGGATSGVETDRAAAVTMGIAQVDLSTVTRPPQSLAAAAVRGPAAPGARLLNRPTELIRFLWEASITQSGGFYLYYWDADDARGLPDRIFDDKDEAALTLVVLHAQDADQGRLANFMNAAAVALVDDASTVIYAKADPPADPPEQIPSSPAASLGGLAVAYYSDVGDLAVANAALALRAGAHLVVGAGVYQAPPGGVALADVAARFGTTVEALGAANPRFAGGLPDPLPALTAIHLPALPLVAGQSAHTATLADVASFYGADLTALAAANRDVAGLFGDGQTVTITGGPRLRAATVPPGVVSLAASRPVPAPIPTKEGATDPDAPGFAQLSLLHAFSLLDARVARNVDFSASKAGVPTGPTTEPQGPATRDKIRAPRLLLAGEDTWDYGHALPYASFVDPPSDNPYAGVGRLFQLACAWQDYYGNRLVTTLSDPAPGDVGPLDRAPMLTGYTDPLVGLGQWPSVRSSWQVRAGDGGAPLLEVLLDFDRSAYEGLIVAHAAAAGSITATFTVALDPASATSAASYEIDGATVCAASLRADGRTVDLTVSGLSSGQRYTLRVRGVKAKTGTAAFDGQAGFDYPDDPTTRSSSVQASAARALRVYERLLAQLRDPNGVALTVETSLVASPIALTPGMLADLDAWLFAPSGSIASALHDRVAFGTSAAWPAADLSIVLPLDRAAINGAQIFELDLAFRVARTGGVVAGDLETSPGIRSVATTVAPLSDALDGGATLGLTRFAQSFEAALADATSRRKVATGIDRARASSASGGGAVWAVRLGLDGEQGISYAIEPQSKGNPIIFSPRPISSRLESRTHVPIRDYDPKTGIAPAPTRYLDFASIDLDTWGRALFAAVDGVLTPALTASIQLVDQRYPGAGLLDGILADKAALADIVKHWMIPVYAGETADPSAAVEAFHQALLARLSSAYDVRAALQFAADVNAAVDDPLASAPPELYGDVRLAGVQGAAGGPSLKSLSFGSPKLPLAQKSGAPLVFLVAAPDTVTGGGGEVLKAVTLDLSLHGVAIEHQIGAIPGIEGYEASSWLHFVIADPSPPLDAALGSFPVPLVLRAFPTTPATPAQAGQYDEAATDLSDVTRWAYTFTYALPFHYPQDRVHGTVEFNLQAGARALRGLEDAFPALAELITVMPAVRADLDGVVAGIDATTTDEATFARAKIALSAFNSLVHDVVVAAGAGGLALARRPRALAGAPDLTYTFTVDEGSIDQPGTPGALLVTITGAPPIGMGTPAVLVAPDLYDAVPPRGAPPAAPGSFAYVYLKKKAHPDDADVYLAAGDGQAIADRTVALPGLDAFQRQDARATVLIKRNEVLVDGRPTADAFVYTTPEASFVDPLCPTIDPTGSFDISAIGAPPSPRPLLAHLTALFGAILAANSQPSLTAQVEITYAYRLNQALSPVSLPLVLQAPLPVSIAGSGPGTLAQMLAGWASAIELWFSTYQPLGGGELWLDLAIMSDLTASPMPLLRLRRLHLPLAQIAPPLPTTATALRLAAR